MSTDSDGIINSGEWIPANLLSIGGVTISCMAEKRKNGMFQMCDVGPHHNMHRAGVMCPVSTRIGLPLMMCKNIEIPSMDENKENSKEQLTDEAGMVNPMATCLMMDPETGIAPLEYAF